MNALSIDYDISAENMLDMTEDVVNDVWGLFSSQFISKNGGTIYRKILINNSNNKQIFKMNDGIFILEVENDCDISYYYSKDINELFMYDDTW